MLPCGAWRSLPRIALGHLQKEKGAPLADKKRTPTDDVGVSTKMLGENASSELRGLVLNKIIGVNLLYVIAGDF